MNAYLICYDLIKPHDGPEDYERVIKGIKARFPVFAHVEKSVFAVKSYEDLTTVRNAVAKLLSATDRLFVAEMSGWAWNNMETAVHTWLAA